MSTNQGNGLWTIEYGELGATLKVLQDQGVSLDHLARLRSDKEYAKRVAEFMLQGGLEASTDQKLARALVGQNFFGPEEWSALYGVRFTKAQLRKISEFPWSEDVLNGPCPFVTGKSVKDTHFAFLGLEKLNGTPLTILRLHELHPPTGQPKFYFANDPWYRKQTFAGLETCEFRWYLMPLEIVPNSESKTYNEQRAMLPGDYEIPSAVEEVVKDILYYRKNGVYLNPTRWDRCRDVTSVGYRVIVGHFDSFGLLVSRYWDGHRYSNVGLTASRKS